MKDIHPDRKLITTVSFYTAVSVLLYFVMLRSALGYVALFDLDEALYYVIALSICLGETFLQHYMCQNLFGAVANIIAIIAAVIGFGAALIFNNVVFYFWNHKISYVMCLAIVIITHIILMYAITGIDLAFNRNYVEYMYGSD